MDSDTIGDGRGGEEEEDDYSETLGTTTAGFTLTDFVVLGADRKGTKYDEYGNEIIEEKDKVFQLPSDLGLPLGVTRAGSEIHSDKMIQVLSNIANRYLEPDEFNMQMMARKAFLEIEENKGKPNCLNKYHQGNILMGGFNIQEASCLIYMNNAVCMDLTKVDITQFKGKFQTGSGSGSAWIFFNTNSYSQDMLEEDAVEYMQDLIYNSICHDNHSGLGIDVMVIRRSGCQPVIHVTIEEYICIKWMRSFREYPVHPSKTKKS